MDKGRSTPKHTMDVKPSDVNDVGDSSGRQPQAKAATSAAAQCLLCHVGRSDALKLAAYTMLPYGLTAAGVYCWSAGATDRKKRMQLYKTLSKPWWSVFNTRMAACIDLLTVAPVGAALFLVTKKGIDSPMVYCSMAAFSSLMVSNLFSIYAFFKQRKLKFVICAALMISLSSIATTISFGKCNRLAGFLMVPCAIWSIFQTAEISYAYLKTKGKKIGEESAVEDD